MKISVPMFSVTVPIFRYLAFGLCLALTLACPSKTDSSGPDTRTENEKETGPGTRGETSFSANAKAALMPLKKNLMGTLRKSMAENGPEGALDACHLQAQTLTQSAQPASMKVGRSSDRLRNPLNAAPAWLTPILQEYASSAQPIGAREIRLSDQRHAYVEPIYVQALCLNCHGETLTPALATKLAEKYPADKATGYSEGDFRGVFWAVANMP